jgi:hypothetical protein
MNTIVILAGILATLTMTAFVEIVAFVTRKPFHVITILSEMLAFGHWFRPSQQKIIYAGALILHYAIGVGFSYGYLLVLQLHWIRQVLSHALLFGAVAGLIGITGWKIFFAIHPDPPAIERSKYLAVIWSGHIAYAIGLFYSFMALYDLDRVN